MLDPKVHAHYRVKALGLVLARLQEDYARARLTVAAMSPEELAITLGYLAGTLAAAMTKQVGREAATQHVQQDLAAALEILGRGDG